MAPWILFVTVLATLLLAGCGGDDDSAPTTSGSAGEPGLTKERAEYVGLEFYRRVSAGDESGACELAAQPMANGPCEKSIGNLSDLRGELDDPVAQNVTVLGTPGGTQVAGVSMRGRGFQAEALLEVADDGGDWAVGDFNVYYDE